MQCAICYLVINVKTNKTSWLVTTSFVAKHDVIKSCMHNLVKSPLLLYHVHISSLSLWVPIVIR